MSMSRVKEVFYENCPGVEDKTPTNGRIPVNVELI